MFMMNGSPSQWQEGRLSDRHGRPARGTFISLSGLRCDAAACHIFSSRFLMKKFTRIAGMHKLHCHKQSLVQDTSMER
jgi:hypothetical protein